MHVSFQSTGSCIISSVNALNEVNLYVRKQEKGQGKQKRVWAIEMNEARELYLKTYSAVDEIDQMLKEWGIFDQTLRWWHAPMRLGKAIALCMAYEIYKMCTEGVVDPGWKIEKPLSGPQFSSIVSKKMCSYCTKYCLYPGDESICSTNRLQRKVHGFANFGCEIVPDGIR